MEQYRCDGWINQGKIGHLRKSAEQTNLVCLASLGEEHLRQRGVAETNGITLEKGTMA